MILAMFDISLVVAIVWLAWKAVSDDHSFRAIVHFIAMGLFVALAWVRLRAPDVAIAEAAVGAGLTGALVMSGAASILRMPAGRSADSAAAPRTRRAVAGCVSSVLFLVVGYALLSLPEAPRGLTAAALANLPDSGVRNPVTAALMNYRAYDTLLEIAVLLISVVAVWSVRPARIDALDTLAGRPLLMTLARIVVPGLILASAYLLWRGGFAPGGAFQGGALLGGICVLLIVSGLAGRSLRNTSVVRFGLAVGTLTFVAVAAGAFAFHGNLLEYRNAHAKIWIFVVETAAMVSIGLTLGALYLGGRPATPGSDSGHGDPR